MEIHCRPKILRSPYQRASSLLPILYREDRTIFRGERSVSKNRRGRTVRVCEDVPTGTSGQINSYGGQRYLYLYIYIHTRTRIHSSLIYTRTQFAGTHRDPGSLVLVRRKIARASKAILVVWPSTRNSHLSQKEIKLFPEVYFLFFLPPFSLASSPSLSFFSHAGTGRSKDTSWNGEGWLAYCYCLSCSPGNWPALNSGMCR